MLTCFSDECFELGCVFGFCGFAVVEVCDCLEVAAELVALVGEEEVGVHAETFCDGGTLLLLLLLLLLLGLEGECFGRHFIYIFDEE